MSIYEIVGLVLASILILAVFIIPLIYTCDLDKKKAQKQLELLDLLKKYFETKD